MKMQHGLAFPDADTFMREELRADGTYQRNHLWAALAFVTDHSCAIDGGAHVGTWAREMAAVFTRVIAVEPSPDTFECLTFNLQACTNVDCKAVALGAAAGTGALRLPPDQEAKGNTGARYVTPGGPIPVEAIDDWHLPSLGFLKLDVEGSEYAALMGAEVTIARYTPIILVEDKALWATHYGLPRDVVGRVMARQGYRLLAQVGRDAIWGPR